MSHQQKKVPSSLADLGVSGDILVNKGNIDCSANPNYPAATAGDTYIVSVAGKIGGASGTDVDIKDMIVCKTTAIAGTQAAVGSSWFVLDGDDDLTLQILGTLINSATDKATPVDADHVGLMDSAAGNITKKLSWLNIKATLKTYFDTLYAAALGADDNYVTDAEKANLHAPGSDNQDLSGYQLTSAKDATGGYAGLTLFKINFKNAANTFTSFLTNANTAARTYTYPDYDATMATQAGTETLSGKTLASPTVTGDVSLAENAAILLDPSLSADGKYNGITRGGTAGATLAFGDICYLDPTDSRWELCDANAAAGADGDSRGILGMCVLAAAADGDPTTMLLNGIIRADAAFPAMTVNAPMYVSETAGDITGTQPVTTDAVIRVVGFAFTADEMLFCPSPDYITHI